MGDRYDKVTALCSCLHVSALAQCTPAYQPPSISPWLCILRWPHLLRWQAPLQSNQLEVQGLRLLGGDSGTQAGVLQALNDAGTVALTPSWAANRTFNMI